jgi:hypothetical protein
MRDSPAVHHQRQILADTIAQLQLPLEVVLSPVPPSTRLWRVWRSERNALQEALRGFTNALQQRSRLPKAHPRDPRLADSRQERPSNVEDIASREKEAPQSGSVTSSPG